MRLYHLHPTYASLPCDVCEKYLHKDGVLTRRRGMELPVLRPAGVVTPCFKCPKIPDDAPERARQYAVEMSDRNRQAFRHYRECKATGRFPDDPIVRRNAGLIREIEDALDRAKWDQLVVALGGVVIHGRTPG